MGVLTLPALLDWSKQNDRRPHNVPPVREVAIDGVVCENFPLGQNMRPACSVHLSTNESNEVLVAKAVRPGTSSTSQVFQHVTRAAENKARGIVRMAGPISPSLGVFVSELSDDGFAFHVSKSLAAEMRQSFR
mmetsp:Transcript_3827/g.8187  ORF Transcript_3827/g.8187 Transcript_3827/m.8187 type:complete len:133 (+) Transcript_3827:250-648(+)